MRCTHTFFHTALVAGKYRKMILM